MRKKVVVFGGCGFIGSYVVEELINNGYDVVVADLITSKYIDEKYFKRCDILDEKSVNEIVKEADIVYNFAGFANLDDAIANPKKALELNVMGNLNILEACKNNNIKRFVYASSAYAMSDKGSFYGISKLTSEKLTEEYYKKFGLGFTIVRYGSVYGERDYSNNYIYNLLKKAIETKEINHSGDGEEIREYIHVADVAKLAVDIIKSDEFVNEHIILTGVERMQRKELFDMINEILGGNIKINLNLDGYHNHYKTTPYSFLPIRSKKLTANPYIDMGQGLIDCLKDIEDNCAKN
ncbi:NAD(P)-dependent oxidoreductase [Aliarcobacter skirrowii]|uniref:NAD-dependent epimerase/dehydratase family protein n=1 Tax=Aliarcobacter skirrowii TaxID=28200 RepID=UPI002A362909|nr:NAD(P)-dependent oxidoreductase [Aliarcobacter skirrowii]MDY0181285.1 NAD(P)-dependent oxidoreductase [Aliarcobacter skirrowii]